MGESNTIFEKEPTVTTEVIEARQSPPSVRAEPMALIELAVKQGADPDQLGKLMDLQERWAITVAAEDFSRAMSKFQANAPAIHKGRRGGHANYAGYDDVMKAIRPLLAECGMSVSFDTVHSGEKGLLTVVCIIRKGRHESRTTFSCPVPTDMKVNASQQYGAALSYAKRYALQSALNLVVTDEDTDARGIGDAITERQAIELSEILGQLPADRQKRFLDWANVESVDMLPANMFAEARRALIAACKKG